MSAMGVRIEQFDVPVCSSFQAKILKDQLCYEVDLQKYSNKHNIERQLKLGFNFLLDYNEDRQVSYDYDQDIRKQQDKNLASSVVETDNNQNALISLNTIGKYIGKAFTIFYLFTFL